ncbi:hypothetical protein Rhopal_004305-T1 [Rhodotorula paludigena]|uniref:Uncharacterized protein n=1 Tax=Rhodotorula paludigena TaxID=86838 RepID=A0AAV5GP12_9BASI|nr:hypothetical protein Rhopal_004305-T1 [Rhodotorula paludigena]
MAIASSSSSAGEDFSRFTARRIGNGTGRDRVRSVAWNLDGRRLATGGTDKSLRIFLPDKDVRSGTEYRGHMGEISVVRWNPTHPERLATVSSAEGSKPTSVIETNGMNITMTWSPDGRHLVVGNRNDDIMWIDADEQTVIRKTRMPKETNEAFFSHNSTLLTTLVFGDAQIVAFPSDEPVHSIEVANLPITVGDLDPRGRDHVRTCRFSHDGAYLASSSSGQNIHIHNVPTLSEAHVLPVSGGAPADALAWHPAKNVLAYAGQDAWIWGAGV